MQPFRIIVRGVATEALRDGLGKPKSFAHLRKLAENKGGGIQPCSGGWGIEFVGFSNVHGPAERV
jgi:hypothetical protein